MVEGVKKTAEVDRCIGALIRKRRVEVGVSQTQLAESCGVSFQQVQKYENGANRIAVARLIQICDALDIRPSALLAELEPERPGGPLNLSRLDLLAEASVRDLLGILRGVSPEARRALTHLLSTLPLAPAPPGAAAPVTPPER